jgi:hypothetical protein
MYRTLVIIFIEKYVVMERWKINHLEIIFLHTGVCIHCNQ